MVQKEADEDVLKLVEEQKVNYLFLLFIFEGKTTDIHLLIEHTLLIGSLLLSEGKRGCYHKNTSTRETNRSKATTGVGNRAIERAVAGPETFRR